MPIERERTAAPFFKRQTVGIGDCVDEKVAQRGATSAQSFEQRRESRIERCEHLAQRLGVASSRQRWRAAESRLKVGYRRCRKQRNELRRATIDFVRKHALASFAKQQHFEQSVKHAQTKRMPQTETAIRASPRSRLLSAIIGSFVDKRTQTFPTKQHPSQFAYKV